MLCGTSPGGVLILEGEDPDRGRRCHGHQRGPECGDGATALGARRPHREGLAGVARRGEPVRSFTRGTSERALAGMARDALKVYSGMHSTVGRSVGYRKTGVLVVAGRQGGHRGAREGRGDAARSRDQRPARRRHRDAPAVPGIEVGDDAMGSYEPDGGYIEPRQAIETFAALARQGATTRTGVDKPRVIVEGGRAVGVSTSEEFGRPTSSSPPGPGPRRSCVSSAWRLLRVAQRSTSWRCPTRRRPRRRRSRTTGTPTTSRRASGPIPSSCVRWLPGDHRPLERPARSLRAEAERTRLGRIGFEGLLELERPEALEESVGDELREWARPRLHGRMPVYQDMTDLGGQAA